MGEQRLIQKTKLEKYFYRLNDENQELIIFEMINLYRKQSTHNNNTTKEMTKNNYISQEKIIFVNFQK